jgi:hypothetical protein
VVIPLDGTINDTLQCRSSSSADILCIASIGPKSMGKSVSGVDGFYNVFPQLQPICNHDRKGDSSLGLCSIALVCDRAASGR